MIPSMPIITDVEYELFKRKMLKERGFNLSHYTPSYVHRRINACLLKKNCNFAHYLRLLSEDPAEFKNFLDTLTINVTEFFRDPAIWDSFVKVCLGALLVDKQSRKDGSLRIWSAGCASGEEPYSIAILLREFLGADWKRNYLVTITATDIDETCLQKAKKGYYFADQLNNVKPAIMKKYFTSVDPHALRPQYKISEEIKAMVQFRKYNFFEDKNIPHCDIIFCRNAMIYLTQEKKDQLLKIFYDSLSTQGFLIIGKSETIFSKSKYIFYSIDQMHHIFRKERRDVEVQKNVFNEKRSSFYWGAHVEAPFLDNETE